MKQRQHQSSSPWMRGDAPEHRACRVFCRRALFTQCCRSPAQTCAQLGRVKLMAIRSPYFQTTSYAIICLINPLLARSNPWKKKKKTQHFHQLISASEAYTKCHRLRCAFTTPLKLVQHSGNLRFQMFYEVMISVWKNNIKSHGGKGT